MSGQYPRAEGRRGGAGSAATLAAALLVGLAACTGARQPAPGGAPAPANAPAGARAGNVGAAGAQGPALPPIPHVTGPLAITVVYPRPGALITSRDSNFILGSVGTGDATLTINGFNVPVEPNGAFLAWLPVPDSASSRYDLVAAVGADTVRLASPVRLPPSRLAQQDSALADTLAELRRPFPDSGQYVTLEPHDSTVPDTDRTVIVRPVPSGTYKWFLLPGTVVQVTGRSPGYERIRLDAALDAWVSTSDIRPAAALPTVVPAVPIIAAPPRASPPHRVVERVRVVPAPDWVDVVFSVGERPPFLIEEENQDLVVTFYSTQASTDLIQYVGHLSGPPAPPDTLVRSVTWSQATTDRARYTVHLSRPPFGYLVLWTGSSFVLRVRRTPVVDPSGPLRGRTIVVDAGHPPAGSTGPTGLYEPVATLAIAQELERQLTARGAAVIMTRRTADAVTLTSRPVTARRVNADAFVSIHLNALPDGLNPFTSHGTGSYYFHPHSIALARDVQAGMVRALGLRDLGVHYDNLAVVRGTWMPAVLCEGAFIIIPEQEAALRVPAFQAAYARGVADGLEHFFRDLAGTTHPALAAAGGGHAAAEAAP